MAHLCVRAISTIQNLDGTAVYAYTTLISVFICLPLGLIVEGPVLIEGVKKAIAQVGAKHFYTSLLAVGLFYHLYNQVRLAVRIASDKVSIVCVQHTGTCQPCVPRRVQCREEDRHHRDVRSVLWQHFDNTDKDRNGRCFAGDVCLCRDDQEVQNSASQEATGDLF